MKRIVIRIITYNQEKYVGRALDSVLQQKDWGLFRVIVCDDCSKDRTWEIIQKYKSKYPDIFDIYRNDHNLGIYENVEKADGYIPDCDLIGSLSGDDEYCDGYFEAVQKMIEEASIDTTEAVGIYADWKNVKPNGTETVFCQDKVLLGYSAWELKLRGLIINRSLLISKKVKDGFKKNIFEKGLRVAESNYDAQKALNISKMYYCPVVATIYYSGIGVSKHLNLKESDYYTTQGIEKWKFLVNHYITKERDLNFAKYEILKAEYYMAPTWKKFFKLMIYFHKGQLPRCYPSFTVVIGTFLELMRYKICFK